MWTRERSPWRSSAWLFARLFLARVRSGQTLPPNPFNCREEAGVLKGRRCRVMGKTRQRADDVGRETSDGRCKDMKRRFPPTQIPKSFLVECVAKPEVDVLDAVFAKVFEDSG